MMHSWKGLKVVVVGAARQGTALARYLVMAGARVVLNDQRPAAQLQAAQETLAGLPVEWVCGGHPLTLLEGADFICPSGGVSLDLPLLQEAMGRGIRISNDSQIFLEAVPCRVIGITGSAGKTTTTTLTGRMAEQACQGKAGTGAAGFPNRAWTGGNIGNPLISNLGEIGPDDLVVMELSSFQLEIMTRSPQVAAILNISPNHLDRHGTMEAYIQAKARILDYQEPNRAPGPWSAVLGREDAGAWGLAARVRSQLWSFGRTQPAGDQVPGSYVKDGWITLWDGNRESELMPLSAIQLRGEHNLLNVLAACAICAAVGLPASAMQPGVEGFMGVPHRLEFVRTWGGADWYNDSIATAPERSMAALRSFDEPVVLLAGGRDKDLPWEDFAALVHQRVDHLILFGEAAEKVHKVVGDPVNGRRPYTLAICAGLKSAVQEAARLVGAGDVVLLSPGGTSFDEFRDFEERGEAYRKWVHELL